MKRVLIWLVSVILASNLVQAEVVSYEDEYISFSYDNEILMKIARVIQGEASKFPLQYYVSTQMYEDEKTSSLDISLYIPDDGLLDAFLSRDDVIVVSEDPLTMLFVDEKSSHYKKIIEGHDEYLLEVNLYLLEEDADDDASIKLIYDTVTASKNLWNLDFLAIDWDMTYIFRNAIYSDDAVAYAKQAIKICKGYLDLEISPDDARKRMSSIFKAAENLKSNGEYVNDSDLYYALYSSDHYFEDSNDVRVMEMKSELENLFHNYIDQ